MIFNKALYSLYVIQVCLYTNWGLLVEGIKVKLVRMSVDKPNGIQLYNTNKSSASEFPMS